MPRPRELPDAAAVGSPSRDTWLYFACQALVSTSNGLLVAASALVGASLAGDPRLATMPVALQHVATLLTAYPASHLMAAIGRRSGFSLGALAGMAGAALATAAVMRGSFALFCAGSFLVGCYLGFANFYRFAAVESAAPERRERALGWVMSSGVLAAFIGPWLASATRGAWSIEFAATYAALFIVAVLALLLLQLLRAPARVGALPDPPGRARTAPASFAVAVAAGMVSNAAMVFVMTATPLAMSACHHAFDHTATVIQWHVVAMYAPSILTGRLVARLGAPRVVIAGLLLCAMAALVNASGTSVAHFCAGLVLLGLGWNLAFIGVTAMLAQAAPDRRATVQGLGDLMMFSAVALASLLAGVIQHVGGWPAVNLAILPPLALVALVIATRLRVDAGEVRAS